MHTTDDFMYKLLLSQVFPSLTLDLVD